MMLLVLGGGLLCWPPFLTAFISEEHVMLLRSPYGLPLPCKKCEKYRKSKTFDCHILSPFPLVLCFIPSSIGLFLQKHYMSCHGQEYRWKTILVSPLPTNLESLNSLIPWKLPSSPGQVYFLPLVSLCNASWAGVGSQPFLHHRPLCAIPRLSVTEWSWEVGMV